MSKLKVALVGCGKMGMQHLRAISSSRYSEIIAISDPRTNAEKIRGVVGKNVEFFSSASELFSKTDPDAVHVVTPPLHTMKSVKWHWNTGHMFLSRNHLCWKLGRLRSLCKSPKVEG